MVDANTYLFINKQIESAQERAENFSDVILASAKTVAPDAIAKSSGFLGIGTNVQTNITAETIAKMREDLMWKPDPAYANYATGKSFPSALVAFEKMIGNEVAIAENGTLQLAAVTDANIAALGAKLDEKYEQFASIQLKAAQEEPTMQPAKLTEPAEPSLSDRVFKPLQREHQENENRRIEEQIRKGGGAAPQASMQGCDFNPADLSTLAPSCPKGPGGSRELS